MFKSFFKEVCLDANSVGDGNTFMRWLMLFQNIMQYTHSVHSLKPLLVTQGEMLTTAVNVCFFFKPTHLTVS